MVRRIVRKKVKVELGRGKYTYTRVELIKGRSARFLGGFSKINKRKKR